MTHKRYYSWLKFNLDLGRSYPSRYEPQWEVCICGLALVQAATPMWLSCVLGSSCHKVRHACLRRSPIVDTRHNIYHLAFTSNVFFLKKRTTLLAVLSVITSPPDHLWCPKKSRWTILGREVEVMGGLGDCVLFAVHGKQDSVPSTIRREVQMP